MNQRNFVKHAGLFLSLFGLLFTVCCNVYASVQVEPGRFLFFLKPGEKTTNVIKVTNKGSQPTEVRAALYDWTMDEQERLVTLSQGSRQDSLNGYIKFNPSRFKLSPGESQNIRFTLTAPTSSKIGEHRGIVFFEEETGLIDKATGAKVVTEVGATIYLTLNPSKLLFRLAGIKVEQKGDELPQVTVTTKNEGTSHTRYFIRYQVINEKKVEIDRGQLNEIVLLPGFRKVSIFPLSTSLPPGKYNLLLEIKFYNTDRTITQTIPFVIEKNAKQP